MTFTWTYSGAVAGPVTLSTTVAGTDTNSGASLSTGVVAAADTITTPGAFAAAIASPAMVSTGQLYRVWLTVTNTGGTAVTGLSATIYAGPGGGLVSGPQGPVPVDLGSLAAGAATTFVFSYTATGAGAVAFTVTVTGSTLCGGVAVPVQAVETVAVTQQAAVVLVASAVQYASAICAGQPYLVTVTVTNTGQADATGVDLTSPFAVSGSGVTAPSAGPNPSLPFVLAGGAAETFTWTFSGSVAGPVVLTVTVAGTDANGGWPVVSGPAVTNSVALQAAGILAARTSVSPGQVSIGQWITVVLTVTNTGQADVTGVVPEVAVEPGGALVGLEAGPVPAGPLTLTAGASQAFVWTWSANGAGLAGFTATATGSTCGGSPVLAASSVSATIQSPALLAASVATGPGAACTGEPIIVTLTVTNTGGATASGLAAAPWFLDGTGAVAGGTGPTPALGGALAGGASMTFTWTYTGSAAGLVTFTTTVTATDANSGLAVGAGPAASAPQSFVTAGALVAAAAAGPVTVSAGQWVTVELTVTNAGGEDVSGITATVYVAGSASLEAGPAPAGPVTLAAGAAQTFVWTFSTAGSGALGFTMTANGITLCGGTPVPVLGAATAAVTVQAPAALAARLVTFPSPRTVGQNFLVTLTVTNTGAAAALVVDPAAFEPSGTGTAGLVAGPTPLPPVTLAGGASRTFTWTYTGTVAGTVVFTTTVTAVDANSGLGVASGPVASGGELILPPAQIDVELLALPDPRNVGQSFFLTLTITNTGATPVTGISSGAFVVSGSGGAGGGVGPTPAQPLASLAAGASVTYTWTYTALSVGVVDFTTTVVGTDAAFNPVTVGPLVSNPVVIQAPAGLAGSLVMAPGQVSTGQSFLVMLTVTNTGGAAATGVTANAFLRTGAGNAVAMAGPNPSLPATLAGGDSVVFTWTYAGSVPGSFTFTTTVTGTDANSGAALTTGPLVSGPEVVQAPAALAASAAAFPSPAASGAGFLVTVTVTNTGGAAATGLTPAAFAPSGTGSAILAAGPLPAAPVVLAGGSSVTFTWTYTAGATGTLVLTTTVTAADANTGATLSAPPVVAGPVTIQTPAILAASLAVSRATCNTGQDFLVMLTVTNTGGAVAAGVTVAGAPVRSGPGNATAGATPAGLPVVLGIGASATFTWTYTGSAAGAVWYTMTVGGTDTLLGVPVAAPPAVSGPVVIQTPAALVARTTVTTAATCVGQPFLVMVTVTNTGGATADLAAAPLLETGGASTPAAGPSPAVPLSLAGGMTVTFTWTYAGSAGGASIFTVTVAGTDANAGTAVSAGPAAAGPVSVTPPGALVAAVSAPSSVTVGQTIQVVLTATNSGIAAVTGVVPAVAIGPGGAQVVPAGGPIPAGPVSLATGVGQSFTWLYLVTGAGPVAFSATATGSDLCAVRAAGATAPMAAQTPASLAASLAMLPPATNVGSAFLLTLTVTNTGSAAVSGFAVEPVSLGGSGAVTLIAAPAVPAFLAGGASVTFTWTLAGASLGPVDFTTTVAGLDANSGWAAGGGRVTLAATVNAKAVLVADAALMPATVSVGQTITATFTVTNTGTNPALFVTPVAVNASTAGLAQSAPLPGVTTIAAGATRTFVWQWQAVSAGTVDLSLSVSGQDSVSGEITFATRQLTGAVQVPGSLAASIALSATDVMAGATVWVSTTVTNTGGAAVAGIVPVLSMIGGAVGVLAAPPPGAITLAGGTSVTWTWTLTAAVPGVETFTGAATGTDVNTGAAVGTVTSTRGLRIEGTGLSVVSFSVSAGLAGLDDLIQVRMTLSNTGTVSDPAVAPSTLAVTGDGRVALVSGPSPSTTTLGVGRSVTVIWVYRAVGGGTVAFTGSASSANGASTGPATSGAVVIREAGGSLADAIVYPNPFRPAEAVGGTVKFRRMPPKTTVILYTVAGERVGKMEADANGLAEWNGRNQWGTAVTPAVYFYVLQAPDGSRRIGKLQVTP